MESGDVAIWLLIVLIALVIIDILIRLFKKKAEKEPKQENEIIDMVNESHEQGVLETDEATMINNIFNFCTRREK